MSKEHTENNVPPKDKWDDHDYCLEMVKKDGLNIVYVKNQTEDICLEAFNSNERAYVFIVNKWPKVYCAMVKKWIGYFILVPPEFQTPEICIEAIKNGLDNRNLITIPWTPEMEKEWVLRHV